METSVLQIDIRKIAAKYAMRRAQTPKNDYDDAAAQEELLRVMEDSAQSRQRTNKILGI
jgi:hypothetical protein